jgi:regulator of sigma D
MFNWRKLVDVSGQLVDYIRNGKFHIYTCYLILLRYLNV